MIHPGSGMNTATGESAIRQSRCTSPAELTGKHLTFPVPVTVRVPGMAKAKDNVKTLLDIDRVLGSREVPKGARTLSCKPRAADRSGRKSGSGKKGLGQQQ